MPERERADPAVRGEGHLMPRYTVLRDFGSHLGNHYVGQPLDLPEGDLPRGFAGLVERVDEPETKDLQPAGDQADDVSPGAGPTPAESATGEIPPSSVADALPESEERPTHADQTQAGYRDKMIRNRGGRRS